MRKNKLIRRADGKTGRRNNTNLLIYLLERLYYYHPGIVIAAGVIIGVIALIALIIWLKEEF